MSFLNDMLSKFGLDSAHIRSHIPGSIVQNRVFQTESREYSKSLFYFAFRFPFKHVTVYKR
jgi:hypothetical protein